MELRDRQEALSELRCATGRVWEQGEKGSLWHACVLAGFCERHDVRVALIPTS